MAKPKNLLGILRGILDIHLTILLLAQSKPISLSVHDIIPHHLTILFQEKYLSCPASPHSEIHGLVDLVIPHLFDGEELGAVSPIPQADLAVHITTHHMLPIPRHTAHPIHQSPHPARIPNPYRLARQEEELAVWEVFQAEGWRRNELHVYGFEDAQVVQQQQVRAGEDQWADGMHCDE